MIINQNTIEELSRKYAKLVILTGIGMKIKPRNLTIKVEPENYAFARMLAEEAYLAGAKFVDIELDDLSLNRHKCLNQSLSDFTALPSYTKTVSDAKLDEDWAFIRVGALEGLSKMSDCDPDKMGAQTKARTILLKRWSEEFMSNLHPWCVVSYPGANWAKFVFPNDDDSYAKLWETLIPILHLDSEDPAESWKEVGQSVNLLKTRLNSLKIKSLHYKSDISDFTIGFRPQALWCGGGDTLPDGQFFFPNIPTAEVFTTPDKFVADGHITTTRPVSVLNQETRQVRLEFSKGKVVSFTAEKGGAIMQRFLEIDEGTRSIGECALVDENSPIARSKRIFGSILYDENASCHLALGQAYKGCMSNAGALGTDRDLEDNGVNKSLMHVDFMVGSDKTNIEAYTYEGKNVLIMENGNFRI